MLVELQMIETHGTGVETWRHVCKHYTKQVILQESKLFWPLQDVGHCCILNSYRYRRCNVSQPKAVISMCTRHCDTAHKLNSELQHKYQNTGEASTQLQLLIVQARWMPCGAVQSAYWHGKIKVLLTDNWSTINPNFSYSHNQMSKCDAVEVCLHAQTLQQMI